MKRVIILSFVLLIAFVHTAAARGRVQSRTRAEADIIEAVLRYGMGQYSPARGYRRYYLAVDLKGGAHGDELMKRFSGEALPVRKFVEGEYDAERLGREGGIVLGLRGVEWLGRSRVKVYGFSFVKFSEGLNWIYEVRRRGRKWVVEDVANFNLS